MLARDYPWDSCQLPLNCFDASFRSFEQHVLPELNARGIAAIGMKSLNGDARAVKAKVVSAEEALAYALSLPVATVVSGIDTPRVLQQNLAVAQGFRPLSARAREALRRRAAAHAADGRFELYKISAAFEGVETRRVHGLPEQGELPT
jgi:predicted aldo/keto reductase-like oxidoreductase